jgi:hypothetical protein
MQFNIDHYKIYTWKNWMILFWILNPGSAINELIFGQRVPKISLEDKTVNKPRIERTVVPCPHCKTMHDGRTWSTENGTAFKNWFGLYCTNCGGIIPCLMNVFSLIILAVTFPIWGWFRKSLKSAWLAKQPNRFQDINVDDIPNSFDKKAWRATGLSWGVSMFVIMSIILPYFKGDTITWWTLLLGLIVWTIGGLGFGYMMKLFLGSRVSRR